MVDMQENDIEVSKLTEKKCKSCTFEDKISIVSIVCRICFDSDRDEPILSPCHCRGTVAFVHRSCLETWLAESNTSSCELCHYVFKTERTPKYTAKCSIWRWIRHRQRNIGFHTRGLRGDLIGCAILTPLAIIITYICIFSADYYNQQRFSNIPAAQWTSVSLLLMIGIILFGYYLWVYTVVRYHGRVWYYFWQRESVVRYVPPSSENISCHHNVNETASVTINMNNSKDSVLSNTTESTHNLKNSIRITIENIASDAGNEIVASTSNKTTNDNRNIYNMAQKSESAGNVSEMKASLNVSELDNETSAAINSYIKVNLDEIITNISTIAEVTNEMKPAPNEKVQSQ